MDNRAKIKEYEKRDKYFDLARELKKLWNMKMTAIPIAIGSLETISKGLIRKLEELEIGGRAETIPMEVSQNIEKSHGDLRRLAVTQTPVQDLQQTLLWEAHKE